MRGREGKRRKSVVLGARPPGAGGAEGRLEGKQLPLRCFRLQGQKRGGREERRKQTLLAEAARGRRLPACLLACVRACARSRGLRLAREAEAAPAPGQARSTVRRGGGGGRRRGGGDGGEAAESDRAAVGAAAARFGLARPRVDLAQRLQEALDAEMLGADLAVAGPGPAGPQGGPSGLSPSGGSPRRGGDEEEDEGRRNEEAGEDDREEPPVQARPRSRRRSPWRRQRRPRRSPMFRESGGGGHSRVRVG